MKFLITILLISFSFLASAQETTPGSADQIKDQQEWVVVFNDPRPARLQGWSRNGYGKSQSNYSGDLELNRFGKNMASKYDMDLQDEWFIPSLGVYCLVVRFNSDQYETMTKLKSNKSVQWVQPSNEFELLNSKTSAKAAELNQQSIPKSLNLPHSIDGKGVTIAIIDSAVDESHQDLVGTISKNNDFVINENTESGESHGTAIAGVMITQPGTKLGVAGVAPAATIHAYRGCWESSKLGKTNCSTLSLARALDAVVRNGADILNLSLTGPKDALLDRLLHQLIDRGTMVVTAFDPARPNAERFPSKRDGILIVRAQGLDEDDEQTFTAPGARVVPIPGNQYDFMHGHSVASAYTSALLALRKQAFDSKQSSQIQRLDWRNTSNSNMAKDLVNEILND